MNLQSISGTGALRLGAAFLNSFWEGNKEVYMPAPTWANHIPIFQHSGVKVRNIFRIQPELEPEAGCCHTFDSRSIRINTITPKHAVSILKAQLKILTYVETKKYLCSNLTNFYAKIDTENSSEINNFTTCMRS